MQAIAQSFEALAQKLRRSTVSVLGRGPGAGSGIIWNSSGLIVTNAHVAREPKVKIELADGRSFMGAVIARNAHQDLAAVRIDAGAAPAAPVADSSRLRAGELVFAVGHPLGINGAVTVGIVHAASPRDRWVQADIRLAPGNSGGPLANASGGVIGINSMVANGVALAVPSNAVQAFLAQKGERAVIGVTIRPVWHGQGHSLGLLVLELEPGSPAERAGLQIGDVLIGANRQPFSMPFDLSAVIEETAPGLPVHIDLLRGGQRLIRPVVVKTSRAAA